MSFKLYQLARSGLVAAGLAAGFAAPALAAPAGIATSPATEAKAGSAVQQIQWNCRPGDNCRRDGQGRGWDRDRDGPRWGRDRDRDGPRWDRDRGRHDDWRRWHRPPPPRHYGGGPGIYFQFGGPVYREPPRYVAPRPVYRARLSQAHVNWCYNRYRSYRAWDNSFQPYGGPRQQCWSPFS